MERNQLVEMLLWFSSTIEFVFVDADFDAIAKPYQLPNISLKILQCKTILKHLKTWENALDLK